MSALPVRKMQEDFNIIIKPVGADCNLSCKYCFYTKTARGCKGTQGKPMAIDVLEKMIADFLSQGLPESVFCWQGGEPTLAGIGFYESVTRLQKKHGNPGQIIGNALQTNGVLINEEWAKFLADSSFFVGLSLDGPREVHDRFRCFHSGEGSFDYVMEGLRLLRKHHVNFNILTTLHSASKGHEREIYGWLVSQGFSFLQFVPVLEREAGDGSVSPFSLIDEDYGKFLCDVFDAWCERGYPDVSVRLFDEILQYYVSGQIFGCTSRDLCQSYFLIERNGDIFPCDFFVRPEWKLGNLMEAPLESFFACEVHNRFAERKALNRAACGGCRWYSFCRGDCMRLRPSDGSRSYFCSAYQRFFEYSRSRFVEMANSIKFRTRHRVYAQDNRISEKPGRNEPCPCGSGKKFKKCCLNT